MQDHTPADLAALTPEALTHHLEQLDAEDDAVRRKLEAPDALAKAARWYGQQGIAVFPLRPRSKQPLIRSAHPGDPDGQRACAGACGKDGHGLYDATTDPDRIARWWTTNPQANIGIRTGLQVDVIDIDGPRGMWTYIDKLLHGTCPRHDDGRLACCDTTTCPGDGGVTLRDLAGDVLAVAETHGDNGGLHLYVRPTGDTIGSNILPGIDYRGDGGYVVAPPSRGNRGIYTWRQPLTAAALEAAA